MQCKCRDSANTSLGLTHHSHTVVLPTAVLAAYDIPVHPPVPKGAEMSSFPPTLPTQTRSLGGCLFAYTTKTSKCCGLSLHTSSSSMI